MRIKEKSISLSQKAKEEIIDYIREEGLQPDDALPSELMLMEMLGVSRYIVREALALIEQDKIIYKIQGKGTFVYKIPMKIEGGLEKLESIKVLTEKSGYKPGSKWIEISESTPNKDMINKLKVKKNEKIITFKRIKTADNLNAAFCVDTMKKSVFGDKMPDDAECESMFQYLKDKFDIEIEYAISEIIPTYPTDEMVKLLKVDKNQLFLLLNQVHYDKQGNPIIYSMDYYNPKVFRFKVNRTK